MEGRANERPKSAKKTAGSKANAARASKPKSTPVKGAGRVSKRTPAKTRSESKPVSVRKPTATKRPTAAPAVRTTSSKPQGAVKITGAVTRPRHTTVVVPVQDKSQKAQAPHPEDLDIVTKGEAVFMIGVTALLAALLLWYVVRQ